MSTLALVGPTASGKSAVALEVARARAGTDRPVELIAVDAFTIYRGMDVATAKPSTAEREEVPHHLVDELDPWEDCTVAGFQRRARDAVARVRSRGAVPLLVGGSGLYFRAVVDDLRFPPTDPAIRAALERRFGDDHAAAHAELRAVDPVAAERIQQENLRRTVRALEVYELTGERFSDLGDGWDRYESIYPDLTVVEVEPPGGQLRARIEHRAREMVQGGLLEEAAVLRALPQPLSRTAAQAIGYREAFAVLDGRLPSEELAAAVARRTWRYATRQRSWFRADPRCTPIDVAAAAQLLSEA